MNGNSMHMVAALWASDIADHVLPTFESIVLENARPRMAVQAARDWAQGKILMKDARKAAYAAHRAARQAHELHFGKAAQAARAAGHAAATAHVIGHAAHSAN